MRGGPLPGPPPLRGRGRTARGDGVGLNGRRFPAEGVPPPPLAGEGSAKRGGGGRRPPRQIQRQQTTPSRRRGLSLPRVVSGERQASGARQSGGPDGRRP